MSRFTKSGLTRTNHTKARVPSVSRRPVSRSLRADRIYFHYHEPRRLSSCSAERNPQKTAFYGGNAEISYERLDDSTTALAHWFLRQDLQPGDRMAVHWANSIQAVQLLYGLFKAGMIAVTVNTRLKPRKSVSS